MRLEKEILNCYNDGCTCAQSVLRGIEKKYGLEECHEIDGMCNILHGGMGVGCFCAALTVSIMCFGRMFDESTAKRLRIRFLSEFRAEYPSLNCSVLKKGTEAAEGCAAMLEFIGRLVEIIIEDEQQ